MKLTALAAMLTWLLFVSPSDKFTRVLAKHDELKYSHEHVEFYRSLFAACNELDLIALSMNKNHSIATQSAWEIVTQTVPKEYGPEVYRPDSNKLAWFVGFFRGAESNQSARLVADGYH